MKNLAGVEDCDVYIREELEKAGIAVYNLREPCKSEVSYVLYGSLGGKQLTDDEKAHMERVGFLESTAKHFSVFVFTRAWYYWRVNGYVPLPIAEEMYANSNGVRDIRANGHCACPPPSEQLVQHKVCGMNVVDHYHIDTQEGLNYFVQTMIKHGLV